MVKRETKNLVVLLVVFLVLNIGSIVYIDIRISEMQLNINSIKDEMNQKIDTNSADTQSKINELSSNLMQTESDIKMQINSIKADTSSDFSGIIENAVNSVVSIKTDVAQGTGFIISSDGYVITNAHVLSGARTAIAITSEQETKKLELIDYNLTLDLALLKTQGNYDYLEFGNSDNIQVGQKVIAIGNPLGLSFSVSEGIISAKDRIGDNKLPAYIQTDTALNPGNSGGPLINTHGKVIGINNFKITGENLGFALESNYIKDWINSIPEEKLNETIIV